MAEFRDESYLVSRLSILVDEERLVRVTDVLVVLGLVVLFVGDLFESQVQLDHLPKYRTCRKCSLGSCRIRLCLLCRSSDCT